MGLRKLYLCSDDEGSTVIFLLFADSFKCNLVLLPFLNHDFTLKPLSLEGIHKTYHVGITAADHLSTYAVILYRLHEVLQVSQSEIEE